MVSVIIPAYNEEKYLRECVQSVLAQDFRDMEVIIVNDGSTDSTPRIIRELAAGDPRIRPLDRPNGGMSAARNSALDIARGEWVTFVDADDMLLPGALTAMTDAARLSGCKLVYTRSLGDKGKSPLSGKARSPLSVENRLSSVPVAPGLEVADAAQVIETVLYQRDLDPSSWGKLYHRSLFDSLRFRDGILYEDLDIFYLVAARAGSVVVLDRQVYFYRVNPVSVTHTFSPHRFDVLQVTERMENHFSAAPRLLAAARDRRLSAAFNMFGLIAAQGGGDHAATADECWNIIRRYRLRSLRDPEVRLKNKLGILASFLGRRVLALLGRMVY